MNLKRLPIFVLSLVFALFLVGCKRVQHQEQPEQDPILLSIERYLEWEAENGFTGTVLVKIPGNDPLVRAFGYANEEQLLPNASETVFDIGSITKQFTGAAIMKLVMNGQLNLSDSIGKFLPTLAPDKLPITFHQLLTHTSGLPKEIGADNEILSKEVLLRRINEIPLISSPGTAYNYSHTGYNLLGVLIEQISGTEYETFLQNNLFRPAKMKFTGYRAPEWNSTSIAHGYRFCNDWGGPMDSGWLEDGPSWNRRASGGMLSTIQDLYAWHLALLGNEILDEPSKSVYYDPIPAVPINEVQKAGYGWRIIKTTRETNVIAHNGWNGRFYSDFLRYLQEDVTIILLSNRFREGNQSMPYEIAKCIFWPDYQPNLTGRYTQCLDSLPRNRLGQLGGKFLSLMSQGTEKEFRTFIDDCLASHLIRKFGTDTLVNKLNDLQSKTGPLRIRQIMITDNQLMHIEVHQLRDDRDAFIQIYFDKNEDYKIRGFWFDSPE